MAAVSTIFALIGYEVKCACYSEILCERDYEAFKNLFEKLGVSDNIQYGTFNQLCETVLNEKGNIRELLLNRILRNNSVVNANAKAKKKILIIDEVDVFFSPQYYGQLYIPIVVEFQEL